MSVYTSHFAPPADKGDHLCSAPIPVCPLLVSSRIETALVTAPSSTDVCYRFGRLTRGKATVEIMMLVIIMWTDLMLFFVKSVFMKVYENGGVSDSIV